MSVSHFKRGLMTNSDLLPVGGADVLLMVGLWPGMLSVTQNEQLRQKLPVEPLNLERVEPTTPYEFLAHLTVDEVVGVLFSDIQVAERSIRLILNEVRQEGKLCLYRRNSQIEYLDIDLLEVPRLS